MPFQHKYGYVRDERSQFIEDTVEPSVFLPGIISLVIKCIPIIWSNYFLVGGRARAEARIDPRPLRTLRSTAHGVRVSYTLDHMGKSSPDEFLLFNTRENNAIECKTQDVAQKISE